MKTYIYYCHELDQIYESNIYFGVTAKVRGNNTNIYKAIFVGEL